MTTLYPELMEKVSESAQEKAWAKMRKLDFMASHPSGDAQEKINARKIYERLKAQHGDPPKVSPPRSLRSGAGRTRARTSSGLDDIWQDIMRNKQNQRAARERWEKAQSKTLWEHLKPGVRKKVKLVGGLGSATLLGAGITAEAIRRKRIAKLIAKNQ